MGGGGELVHFYKSWKVSEIETDENAKRRL